MPYDSISISRERSSFCVKLTDPELVKANRARDMEKSTTAWQDPHVEYDFPDKAAVLKFLDKAMDIALPADTPSPTP